MAGVRVSGVQNLISRLRNAGEVTNTSTRRQMEEGAFAIRDLARDYAPRDTGALESSIKVEKTRDGGNRTSYEIFVDRSTEGRDGRLVDYYADKMHDGYDSVRPGQGTLAKRAGGLRAGGLYMFRAVQELSPEIIRRVGESIRRALARAG